MTLGDFLTRSHAQSTEYAVSLFALRRTAEQIPADDVQRIRVIIRYAVFLGKVLQLFGPGTPGEKELYDELA